MASNSYAVLNNLEQEWNIFGRSDISNQHQVPAPAPAPKNVVHLQWIIFTKTWCILH